MIKFVLLALRNLRRNIKRNLATGSAIVFGFLGILMLGGYVNRVANYLRVYTVYLLHTGHVVVYKAEGYEKFSFRPKDYSLTPDDQKFIESVASTHLNTEKLMRQIRGHGLIGNGCLSVPFMAKGIEPEIEKELRAHPDVNTWTPNAAGFLKGSGLWNFPSDLGAVALTTGLSRILGKSEVHDTLTQKSGVVLVDCQAQDAKSKFALDANVQMMSATWEGSLTALDGEVVGLYTTGFDESDNAALLSTVGHLQKLYDTHNITQYNIWLKDPSQLTATISDLNSRLNSQGRKFDIYRWDDEKISPLYTGTVQFLYTLVFFIGAVLAAIITLSILNSTTMTVLERSQEVGMFRSLGYKQRHIRWLFVIETAALSVCALALGGLLGGLAMVSINSAGIIYYPPGLAGGLVLKLIPDHAFGLVSGVVIFVLAVGATLLAVSTQSKKNVAVLVGGTLR